jgi:hypothetical protein
MTALRFLQPCQWQFRFVQYDDVQSGKNLPVSEERLASIFYAEDVVI